MKKLICIFVTILTMNLFKGQDNIVFQNTTELSQQTELNQIILKTNSLNRTLGSDGRNLVHMHLESEEVFGNVTQIMYYFTKIEVGGYNNTSTQTLILDTGSGITCFP